MGKHFRILAVGVVVGLLGLGGALPAVDFQEELRRLAEENGKGYAGPLSTAFGTALNTGLYHTAKPHSILGFDISVKMSLVQVSDEDKEFEFIVGDSLPITIPGYGPVTLNRSTLYPDRKTPTVFGVDSGRTLQPTDASLEAALREAGFTDSDISTLRSTGQFSSILSSIPPINTPPGLGIDMVPMAMPQFSVGLPFKTEVLIRYFPTVEAGDWGKITFWALGVKHNIDQYIPVPMFPVDISAQYVLQKLAVEDKANPGSNLIESNQWAANIHISKKLGLPILSITPYVGLGLESSDLKLQYTYNPGGGATPQPIKFDLEGKNKSRITGGVRLGLAFLTVNADYSLGAYNTASVGVGLTLR